MKSKKKICLFIPNLKVGGAEKVAITLANYFISEHHVDVVVLKDVGELKGELDDEINLISLNVSSMKKEFFGLKKLYYYIREHNPDAVLCFMWPLTIVGVLARIFSRSKCNLVLSDHTTFSQTRWIKNTLKKRVFAASVKAAYMKADHRVMVSDNACRDLEIIAGLPLNSITTIYNPLVIPENINTDQNQVTTKKKLLSVGTLKWAKNHKLLLDAFELLYKLDNRLSLTIVGDGDLKKDIKQIIHSKGLEDAVVLTGQLLGKDLSAEYISSDVFILTSHYEGFSMVIAEALSYGVPVVSVDCRFGPKEILNSDLLGTLVQNYDAQALADAIKYTLDKKFEKKHLLLRAQEFSIEMIGKKYLKLLLESKI